MCVGVIQTARGEEGKKPPTYTYIVYSQSVIKVDINSIYLAFGNGCERQKH